MENLRPEEENIFKDKRNLFRLKKELNYTEIKDIIPFLDEKKKLKQLKIEYLDVEKCTISKILFLNDNLCSAISKFVLVCFKCVLKFSLK